jgi:hypothetical protein
MRPARYEIHVDGVMSADDLDELVGMTATDDGSSTVLRCVIPDQPTLVGVLARVEASGCTVRELRLVGPHDPVGPDLRRQPGQRGRRGPRGRGGRGGGPR